MSGAIGLHSIFQDAIDVALNVTVLFPQIVLYASSRICRLFPRNAELQVVTSEAVERAVTKMRRQP